MCVCLIIFQGRSTNLNVEIDPTVFLAQHVGDDDFEDENDDYNSERDSIPAPIMSMEEGPPILTSLGLTHINHVNPYNYLVRLHNFINL